MMSLIFCTKKVPTDQIPLPFCTAKDEINLQNTREKKNVYEFFKNIWRNLQGIILKKKKTTLVSTLADLLPWPWAYPLLEAETQARVCDILLPWYPAQSSVYSGKGRESRLSWRQSSLPAPALGVPWKDTQAPSAGQRAGIPPQPEQPSLIARGYEDQRFSTPTSRVPCKQGKGAPVGVHEASPGCSRRSRRAAPSWESRGQRPAAWSEVCLVFRLELYTNIHVPRGPNTYTPVHLSTYLHLPKGKGQRKGRPEEKDKDHGWEGPWRAGKESWDCGTGGACKVEPKGHAEAGGSKEEPVK